MEPVLGRCNWVKHLAKSNVFGKVIFFTKFIYLLHQSCQADAARSHMNGYIATAATDRFRVESLAENQNWLLCGDSLPPAGGYRAHDVVGNPQFTGNFAVIALTCGQHALNHADGADIDSGLRINAVGLAASRRRGTANSGLTCITG